MADTHRTVNHLLLDALDRHAAKVCFTVRSARSLQNVTYRQFRKWVFRLSRHLQQLPYPQKRLAIVARNSPEWMAAYVAGMMAGWLVVPIRWSLSLQQAESVLADSGVSVMIGHERDVVHILDYVQDHLPNLRSALFVRNTEQPILPDLNGNGHGNGNENVNGNNKHPDWAANDNLPVMETRDLYTILNRPLAAEEAQAVRDIALSLPGDQLATLFYTPAIDGKMRGLAFSLEQGLLTLESMADWLILDEDDLGYTAPNPLSDFSTLYAALHYMVSGVPNALAAERETSFEELQHLSPTVTLTTPYVFEHIYLQVMDEMAQLPKSSRQVFQWALTVGKNYHAAGLNASPELRESYQRADMTFFNNIRGMMGGRLRRLYATSAPLSSQWLDFAEAIGLMPLNVYSSTRSGGFPAASRIDERVTGSCGQITPGYQIRIADDGEILLRSKLITLGCWQPDGTLISMVDCDGWLHTGDLGRFDSDGNLYLTGHKFAPLILATGRKVNPAAIEEQLTASPYIQQAVVYGEGKRYLSALIVPDLTAIAALLPAHADEEVTESSPTAPAAGHAGEAAETGSVAVVARKEPLLSVKDSAVVNTIERVVHDVNVNLDDWEQIERFTLLENPLHDGNGVLVAGTDREEIAKAYMAELEAMYPAVIPFAKKQVTQVDVDPEYLRYLVEKEGILDAWMNDAGIEFLLELARQKKIDAPSMVNICETVATISQMQNEMHPLSTAFLVGDPVRISRLLPESALQLRQYDHIRRMRRIVIGLARIVDGHVMAYGLDKHGFLRGIHRLDVEMDTAGSDLTGTHYRLMAAISRRCEAVVFSIPRGGQQVRVFSDGRLVGRYVNGAWIPESKTSLDQAVARLSDRKGYNLLLLRRLIRCAFRMSEQNLGAIFLLGDADAILQRSDESEIQNIATIVNVPLDELSDEELITFAKEDGATVVDRDGDLRGCMVLLRPAAHTQAQIGPGKGARHSSAAKMSAETDCIAITVSQDGPITVYDAGQRVLAL